MVAPGFIDVHCHLREPGREDVETIATGAQVGGRRRVHRRVRHAEHRSGHGQPGCRRLHVEAGALAAHGARVYPIGAISIGQRGEATRGVRGEMVGAGAVAVSDDGKPVVSAQLMQAALEYARTFGIPVADHCEKIRHLLPVAR